MDTKAIVELLKSFGRFLWFGLLGLVATFLVSLAATQDLLTVTWMVADVVIPVGAWIATLFGFLAKAIDLYVRKSEHNDLNGIALSFLQK